MKFNPSFIVVPLLVTLSACTSESNYDFEASKATLDAQIAERDAPQALFSPDPSAPVLPFPNSLFFQGSTDGTLNIPIAASDDQTLANPRAALNLADGFSTVAPIVTTVSEALDPASLRLGDTIRVYEVTTAGGIAVTRVEAEISDSQLIGVVESNGQLALLPTVPLTPNTDYLVVLTSGITDVDGNGLEASLVYELLKGSTELTTPGLDPLRQATLTHLAAVETASGIVPADVVLSWVFKTQSIREVLQAVKNQTTSSVLLLGKTTSTSPAGGKADIFVGALTVPYYQTSVGENDDPAAALNSYWKNSGGGVVGTLNASGVPDYAPVATGPETIPVLMTVPNAASATGGNMPADGWPVTIFQHSLTRDRRDMLTIADAMADAGRVVIAIDMPMHGVIDADDPLHASKTPFDERERTFDIDLEVNPLAAGEAPDPDAPTSGPDNKPDPTGRYFYNLRNLVNTRDNLRQAVADLFVLSASLSSAQGEGFTLNASDLSFVGHSMGAIVGTTMLSYDNTFQSSTLAMPGGGLGQMFAVSETYGPALNAGLAAVGIEPGSADYDSFVVALQTLADPGDPVNHATTLAQDSSIRLHMIEVLGDKSVPNNVPPLSGTEPLARLLGLQQIAATSSTGGLVKFTTGSHGSFLTPEAQPVASLAATVEMQRQAVTFAATQGTQLPITDTTVIQALP